MTTETKPRPRRRSFDLYTDQLKEMGIDFKLADPESTETKLPDWANQFMAPPKRRRTETNPADAPIVVPQIPVVAPIAPPPETKTETKPDPKPESKSTPVETKPTDAPKPESKPTDAPKSDKPTETKPTEKKAPKQKDTATTNVPGV
jgi:outer membrane biosynthesis protein TonB